MPGLVGSRPSRNEPHTNLQDVYVDVETNEPQLATVKEGFIGRHLTFVPPSGIHVRPNDLRVEVTKEHAWSEPDTETHGEEVRW